MQKLTRICSSDGNFDTVFSMLYIISTTINYMHQLCFIYAKRFSHLLAVRERERVAVKMQGTVFTLARLEIVHCYHQELVSHPMSEDIESLS